MNREASVRPSRLGQFIGHDRIRENISVFVKASLKKGRPMPHTLFYGPPGLGKTTLASIIAAEMGGELVTTSGPVLDMKGTLAAMLSSLAKGDILFIDEIHRLPPFVEEILYPAMEDGVVDVVIGSGPSARSIQVPLEPFTLIGATTRAGNLSSPLKDRFGYEESLTYYEPGDLARIVERSAGIMGVDVTPEAASHIGARSRGTPRIANRLLARVSDVASVLRDDGLVTVEVASAALSMLDVDDMGLDRIDRAIIETLVHRFGGGPAGLKTLANAVGEEAETLQNVHEPYLVQQGFLRTTSRGRMATEKAFAHVGKPKPSQASLV